MRKLKLQVQMTVDGYIAGPNGELDFMVWDWDDELKQYVTALTEPVDCIVLGRKLAEGSFHTGRAWQQTQTTRNIQTGRNSRRLTRLFLPGHLPSRAGRTPFWRKAAWWTKSCA